jgi:SpoIID/LytB domain protein
VGKELEIRRWLSKSHLYSSAFIVKIERDANGLPMKFVFHGAGWGHGVGLCQIGAAVMASKGFSAEEIVKHYFRGIEIMKLY